MNHDVPPRISVIYSIINKFFHVKLILKLAHILLLCETYLPLLAHPPTRYMGCTKYHRMAHHHSSSSLSCAEVENICGLKVMALSRHLHFNNSLYDRPVS